LGQGLPEASLPPTWATDSLAGGAAAAATDGNARPGISGQQQQQQQGPGPAGTGNGEAQDANMWGDMPGGAFDNYQNQYSGNGNIW